MAASNGLSSLFKNRLWRRDDDQARPAASDEEMLAAFRSISKQFHKGDYRTPTEAASAAVQNATASSVRQRAAPWVKRGPATEETGSQTRKHETAIVPFEQGGAKRPWSEMLQDISDLELEQELARRKRPAY
eukprot:TRINITY_DN29135_c0_g1_i4.p1 TRINITY_DN29135_c0_g1~~TRINITY_DN29135_c0_g1_i4.p1  ORF type:complete len:132 (+),score=24.01 TRINITY_DN29135_c0_g1_i4:74-469(+)